MTPQQHPPQLQCDVCIVGAGPAGLVLADALARQGRSVVLLESGESTPDPDTTALNIATISGDVLPPLHLARARAVGGTANIWNTVRDGRVGGKYVPLDAIDLVPREITPWSGWPLTAVDLEPWYIAAHRAVGLAAFDGSGSSAAVPAVLPFARDSLTTSVYRWAAAERFTGEMPAALDASPLVILVHGATAVCLDASSDPGQIEGVHWANLSGASGVVHASTVVLAAGTIENTRLLLLHYRDSARATPYWLGRGFMEHPIDRALTLVSRHPALSPDAGCYAFAGRGARAHLAGRIGLTEELMVSQRLRNASLRLFPLRHRFLSRHLRRLSHRLGRTPPTTYRVLLDLEQAPHPDNRITLTDQLDVLGMPRVHLHWLWRPDDEAFRVTLHQVIQREFARHACGEIRIATGPPLEHGAHHHAGTTRMHHDPAQGVVGADLRVHDHDNLFVVGASVFPTSGVANPTLTVLALALRLADQLARR